tara:strand:- start:366 stop:815 length:450 start_codon:yes stop_codon:yes gene_type:complete
MRDRETIVEELCIELEVNRSTLYRYLGTNGERNDSTITFQIGGIEMNYEDLVKSANSFSKEAYLELACSQSERDNRSKIFNDFSKRLTGKIESTFPVHELCKVWSLLLAFVVGLLLVFLPPIVFQRRSPGFEQKAEVEALSCVENYQHF